MPSSSSVLDEARDLVEKRLSEIEDERQRLERALRELGASPARRGPGRPRGSKADKPVTRRRRRRSGTRANQAVKLIAKEPGTTAKEIAKAMKISPNYLYRVLGDLEKDKKVRKQGRQYFPVS
jgi:DNA invertase Pin-like site-specific DNA recombinase